MVIINSVHQRQWISFDAILIMFVDLNCDRPFGRRVTSRAASHYYLDAFGERK